jgi:hypothetical protein
LFETVLSIKSNNCVHPKNQVINVACLYSDWFAKHVVCFIVWFALCNEVKHKRRKRNEINNPFLVLREYESKRQKKTLFYIFLLSYTWFEIFRFSTRNIELLFEWCRFLLIRKQEFLSNLVEKLNLCSFIFYDWLDDVLVIYRNIE